MPDLEISNLPAIAEAAVASADELALADGSASETKKVTVKDLVAAGVALIDDADIPAAKVAGPFAANTVATATIQNDAVNADKLATDSVTADAIAANAVGASELADNAVDSAAIATNAVITAKITDLNVTSDKLASNSVTTVKILDGNVTYAKLNLSDGDIPGAKLTSSSVTSSQLATNSVTATELADNAVDNGAIANLAVTGGKIAATTITGSNLVNNTITAAQIADNVITATQIAANAVGASELADDAVDTDAILDGAVTSAKIGSGSIAYAKLSIADGDIAGAKLTSASVTATQIANTTITGAKLVNDTITATQIAANAITASELADNAVDEAAIASNAVTVSKIANTTVTYAKLNLSDGDIPAAKIAVNSLTAGQIAANAIGASELADDAVDTAAIASGAVTSAEIATDTIVASNIAANAITASELANNAVTSDKILNGAVTAAKLSGTLGSASIADDAIITAKIADDAVDSTKLAANAVDAAALADNAVDSGAIATSAVIEAKIASNAVTVTKIADGIITPAKLNTSNLDRSLNVASGNLGINNTITAATRSGISYNAQGLITGTVALVAADLPVATSSAVGGVSVGTGLSVSGAGALSLTNSVTGATVSGITFNAQGMITAATALVAGDLPVAPTSAKGAVQITSGGGLTVDGSGNLSTATSGISAGTYQSITVNNKGVATAGAALTATLIPDLAASKITSGSLDAARIAADSIDGSKLSNSSTAIFQSIAQSGYPTAEFSGQILFDTVSEDAWIWDGNAWQAITTLTKGSLVFGGTYNANTSQMVACTSAGLAAGLAVGSNLPSPSATTDGLYVVVGTAGTPSSPAPAIALTPPDYLLGVTNTTGSSWNEVDLSQTIAGQVASNITFTPYGQISSTNVQDALQEVETEKLAKTGGTVSGELLIGNTGSFVFEGATVDAFETRLTVADPTTSDKVITLPNITGTVITSGDTGTVTSTMLLDGTIVNADINASAAIALTKLANVTAAQIIVGNGSNVPTAVAVTGDIGINNAGLTSITAGAIVNADINASAAIAGSKVTTGTTSAVGVLQLTDSATSTSATTAATPAAVKIAKDAADAAATTANAALPKAGGTMTDNLLVDNDKEVRFFEADSNGSTYVGIKGATDKGSEGSYTISLPAASPTAGQILKANASTPTTLEWGSDSATDNTKMPLSGGTFTGDIIFTGDSSNGLWDKSASAFVANLTGNASGSSGSCTGNAATATQLATARNIGGVSFNGTAAINLPGVNTAGNQNTTGSAATVTGAAQSAITSVGTLTGLTTTGTIDIDSDSGKLRLGDSQDLQIYHSGTNTFFENTEGNVYFRNDGAATYFQLGSANDDAIALSKDGPVIIYYDGSQKFQTTNTGATVTGTLVADGLTVDTNTLHVDATNNRVGIGTASPSRSLDINSGTVNVVARFKSTDATAAVVFEDDTGSAEIGCIGTSVVFFPDGTERMRIDSSGKVGIGTTSPAEELHVQTSSGDCIVRVTSPDGSGAFLDLGDASDPDGGRIVYDTGSNLAFNTASTERMRIDSSGKLGINETSPDVALHIKNTSSTFNQAALIKAENTTTGQGSYMLFQNSTDSTAAYVGLDGAGYFNVDAGSLLLTTATGDPVVIATNNGTERFRVTSAGNATATGTVSDSIGNVRSIVYTSKTSAHTLVASDAGKLVYISTGGVTLPNNVMSGGDAITIINNSGSDQTLTQASGLTLYNTADASTGNRVLAGRGMATVWYHGGSTAYISGAGLS